MVPDFHHASFFTSEDFYEVSSSPVRDILMFPRPPGASAPFDSVRILVASETDNSSCRYYAIPDAYGHTTLQIGALHFVLLSAGVLDEGLVCMQNA